MSEDKNPTPQIVLDSEADWTNQTLEDYINYNIPAGWEEFFDLPEVEAAIHEISVALSEEKRTIWPTLPNLLNAFYMCPLHQMKVVIIGQDPYHSPKTAYGLAFSSYPGGNFPASLRNVFTKLRQEGFTVKNPYLGHWANQGVFLINTALTVAESKAGSHVHHWIGFTTLLIKYLSKKEKLVWMLWGDKARVYRNYIQKHSKLLEGGHPSPLNTTGSFLAVDYFKPCNEYLKSQGISAIDWNLL